MSSKPVLYLIDGHAVAYRHYFALPVSSFSTRSGEPTNATYGFTRILMDLFEKTRPDYLAVSFDRGMSGREELYSEYKGTRAKMEDDLIIQMERIEQVVRTFNIPVLALDGYEADDVIGTVAEQATAQGVDVRIITGDQDLLQLLNEHTTVQLPSRRGPDEVYDVARFVEKYGIQPPQLVDKKALQGDSSDNIPGVRGIGEKTALNLLQQFETLDGIYANLELVKGKMQEKLAEGRDSAYLSFELARIRRDLPLTLDLSACVAHDYNANSVLELFRELEFRSFSERMAQHATPTTPSLFDDTLFAAPSETIPAEAPEAIVDTVVVRDRAALEALVAVLNEAHSIAWDVETTSIDQMQAELVGIGLAVNSEQGYYIPVGHQSGEQLPLHTVIDALRGPLTNAQIAKVAHNAVYDLIVTQRYGIDVTPVLFDTMIAEWLRDPTSKFLGLKAFVQQYLKETMTPISHLIGTGKKQKTMDHIAIEEAAPYAAADAAFTYRAAEYLRPELEQSELFNLFETLEMPLVPVLAAMQQAGIALDVPYLGEMSDRLATRLERLEQQIYDLSGGYGDFNINSPKQLNDVLFGKLALPVEGLKKTSHGYSTDATSLEKLAHDTEAPIVQHILEYRELTKLKGTYVDALPELVNPETGRVHTSYNQTGTSTGRLSSSNPNLQNIPIRTEVGREVRRAFIAPPGRVLLAVDYSQIELRVLAHISQDSTLLEAFAQGQDIHAATAATVYGIPLDQVTYDQRSFAKRVNFGLIYGMGAFRLARDSELTLAEAEAFIKTYFERLPGVEKYIEETKQRARTDGYLTTLFGRKRFFPALKSSQRINRQVEQGELRAAINMPIQGTAADIMKRAMIDLHHQLQQSRLHAVMTLQVHDELVLEVPKAELKDTCDLVVKVMENAYQLDAPLRANAQAGSNWRDMDNL